MKVLRFGVAVAIGNSELVVNDCLVLGGAKSKS